MTFELRNKYLTKFTRDYMDNKISLSTYFLKVKKLYENF